MLIFFHDSHKQKIFSLVHRLRGGLKIDIFSNNKGARMPQCIKESEYNQNPDMYVKVSGPHTLEECQSKCGQLESLQEKKGCGCGSN
jgi:hypothetical protein